MSRDDEPIGLLRARRASQTRVDPQLDDGPLEREQGRLVQLPDGLTIKDFAASLLVPDAELEQLDVALKRFRRHLSKRMASPKAMWTYLDGFQPFLRASPGQRRDFVAAISRFRDIVRPRQTGFPYAEYVLGGSGQKSAPLESLMLGAPRQRDLLPLTTRRGVHLERPIAPGVASFDTFRRSLSSRGAAPAAALSRPGVGMRFADSAMGLGANRQQLGAMDTALSSVQGAVMRRAKPMKEGSVDETALAWLASEPQLQLLDTSLADFREVLGEQDDTQDDSLASIGGWAVPAASNLLQVPQMLRQAAQREFQPAGAARELPHKARLEEAFGVDLSHIRFHRCSPTTLEATLGAVAFAKGNYVCSSSEDLYTIAHETMHCLQQQWGWVPSNYRNATGDRFEVQADMAASAIVAGQSVGAIVGMFAPSPRPERRDPTEERRAKVDEPRYQDQLARMLVSAKPILKPTITRHLEERHWLAAPNYRSEHQRLRTRFDGVMERSLPHLPKRPLTVRTPPESLSFMVRTGQRPTFDVRDANASRASRTRSVLERIAGPLGLTGPTTVRIDDTSRRVLAQEEAVGLYADQTIYLNPETFDTRSPASLNVLGHELAHRAQAQWGSGGSSAASEGEADSVGAAVMSGSRLSPVLNPLGGRRAAKKEEKKKEGLTLPQGTNILVQGTKAQPVILIRTAWLLANGAAPTETSIDDTAIIRPILDKLEAKFKYGFTEEQLRTASDGIVPTMVLSTAKKVAELEPVEAYPLGGNLFVTTGLPAGVALKVLAGRATPAAAKDDAKPQKAKTPEKPKKEAYCTILLSDATIAGAGITKGGKPIRSAELVARVIGAVESAMGLVALPDAKEKLLAIELSERNFRTTLPGTWTWVWNHRHLVVIFGQEAVDEWANGGGKGEGGASLGGSGFAKGAGVSQEEAAWAVAYLAEHFGDKPKAGDGDATPPRQITRSLVDALKALEEHDDKEEILKAFKGGGGSGGGITARSIENAVHRYDLAKRRKAHGLGEIESSDGASKPIVDVPVRGEIVSLSEPLVPEKEAQFWFRTERLSDAFRVSRVYVEWQAYDSRRVLIEDETCQYSESEMDDLFDLEFKSPGTYTIYAYVRHNYYRANDFTKDVEVKSESAQSKEFEDDEYGDMKGRTTSSGSHDFDHTLVDEVFADDAYTKGHKSEGDISDDFWEDNDSETRLRLLEKSKDELRELIRVYAGSSDPQKQRIAAHAEEVLEQMKEFTSELEDVQKDADKTLFAVKGTYTSRTAGLRSGPLSLQGIYDQKSKEVTLKDYSMILEREVIEGTGDEGDFDKSLEEAFVDLCKSYPDGRLSIMAEKLEDNGAPKNKFVHYRLKTDSVWKDIKTTVFDPAVDIVVNVTGAILLVFPPTAAAGAAILVTYNVVRTASELAEWADRGTLTFGKGAMSIGQLLLDVMPAVGSAKRFTQLGGKALFMINSTEFVGQAWIITAQARKQISDLKSGVVADLAKVEAEIREIQASRPWDPRLSGLKARREKLKTQFKNAAETVIKPLLANGAIVLGGTALVTGATTRAFRNRVTNLKDSGLLVEIADGPPARYNPETGKIEVNTTKTVTEADFEAAARQQDLDVRMAKEIPDPKDRIRIRNALKTHEIDIVGGAKETRVKTVGDGYQVHLKKGQGADDIIAAVNAHNAVDPTLTKWVDGGIFVHKAGTTPEFDLKTGQIVGDRNLVTPDTLKTFKTKIEAEQAALSQRIKDALDVENVTVTRQEGPTKLAFEGPNSAKVNIAPGDDLGTALKNLKKAAKKAERPTAKPETQPDAKPAAEAKAPKSDNKDVKTYPTPVRDPAALATRTNVIVGNPVRSVADGHAILKKLAAGDSSALGAVGVGKLPDDFPSTSVEWGLGRKPDGDLVIIRGQRAAVNWSDKLEGIEALAHSHPYMGTNALKNADKGLTFKQLLDEPGQAANTIHLVPSGGDIVFCAQRKIGHHEVHTPFRHTGDGRVRNPTGANDTAPTVSFELKNAREVGHHADYPNQVLYEADLVAKSSDGKQLYSGKIYGTELTNLNMREASLKHPFPDKVVAGAPKKQGANLEGKTPQTKPRTDPVVKHGGEEFKLNANDEWVKAADDTKATDAQVKGILDSYKHVAGTRWRRPNGQYASRQENALLNKRKAEATTPKPEAKQPAPTGGTDYAAQAVKHGADATEAAAKVAEGLRYDPKAAKWVRPDSDAQWDAYFKIFERSKGRAQPFEVYQEAQRKRAAKQKAREAKKKALEEQITPAAKQLLGNPSTTWGKSADELDKTLTDSGFSKSAYTGSSDATVWRLEVDGQPKYEVVQNRGGGIHDKRGFSSKYAGRTYYVKVESWVDGHTLTKVIDTRFYTDAWWTQTKWRIVDGPSGRVLKEPGVQLGKRPDSVPAPMDY